MGRIGRWLDRRRRGAPAPAPPTAPPRPARQRPRDPARPTKAEMTAEWEAGGPAERLALWGRIDNTRRGRLLRSLNDWPEPPEPGEPPYDNDDLIGYVYDLEGDDWERWQHVIGEKANGDDKLVATPAERRALKAAYIAADAADNRRYRAEAADRARFPAVVELLDGAGLADEVDDDAAAPLQGGRIDEHAAAAVAEVRARRAAP